MWQRRTGPLPLMPKIIKCSWTIVGCDYLWLLDVDGFSPFATNIVERLSTGNPLNFTANPIVRA